MKIFSPIVNFGRSNIAPTVTLGAPLVHLVRGRPLFAGLHLSHPVRLPLLRSAMVHPSSRRSGRGRRPGPRKRIIKNVKPGAHERHVARYDAHLDAKLAREAAEEARHDGVRGPEPTAGHSAVMPCMRTGGVAVVGTWLSAGCDPPLAFAPGARMTRRVGRVEPRVLHSESSFRDARESERLSLLTAMGGSESAGRTREFAVMFTTLRGELDTNYYYGLARRAVPAVGVTDPVAKELLVKMITDTFVGAADAPSRALRQ